MYPLISDHGQYLKNSYPHSCYRNPTTPVEVGNIINYQHLMPQFDHIIELPLSIIINKSFLDGVFPDKLKFSKVYSIFSSDEENSINNYKPNFSKIFEKNV